MKNKKNYIIIFILIISLFIHLACKNNYDEVVNETDYDIDNIQAHIKAFGIMDVQDESLDLKKLFIKQGQGFNFFITYNGLMNINFSQPIWIKEISFNLKKIDIEKEKGVLQFQVSISPDSNSMPLESIEYDLDNQSGKYQIKFPTQKLSNILKYKSISFDLIWKDYAGNAHGQKIKISDLNIILGKNNEYKATKEFNEIAKNLKTQKEKNYLLSTNDINDLIYYAINGKKEAEKLLLSLDASSAEDGEVLDGIQKWYLLNTKK